jgi:hypothetical protein
MSLPSLICFRSFLLILAPINYYSLNITSTLFLYIHITVYTAVCMSVSSLSNGLTTTGYLMLFSHHPKSCVMYLHISPFMTYNLSMFQNVVCFLLGNSPASEFYMPTFRSTLFHLHRQVGMKNNWVWELLKYLYRKRLA